MIPLVALKAVPWRLIGYGVALGAVVVLFWRINTWHDGYQRLEATERALATRTAEAQQCADRAAAAQESHVKAAVEAESIATRDRATARRIESELQTRLADTESRGRDLARRLQNSRACPGAGGVPPATDSTGQPASASGEPAGADRVGEATAALIQACDRDSLRLGGWIEWWAGVSEGRGASP